jgi:hypothetical protein
VFGVWEMQNATVECTTGLTLPEEAQAYSLTLVNVSSVPPPDDVADDVEALLRVMGRAGNRNAHGVTSQYLPVQQLGLIALDELPEETDVVATGFRTRLWTERCTRLADSSIARYSRCLAALARDAIIITVTDLSGSRSSMTMALDGHLLVSRYASTGVDRTPLLTAANPPARDFHSKVDQGYSLSLESSGAARLQWLLDVVPRDPDSMDERLVCWHQSEGCKFRLHQGGTACFPARPALCTELNFNRQPGALPKPDPPLLQAVVLLQRLFDADHVDAPLSQDPTLPDAMPSTNEKYALSFHSNMSSCQAEMERPLRSNVTAKGLGECWEDEGGHFFTVRKPCPAGRLALLEDGRYRPGWFPKNATCGSPQHARGYQATCRIPCANGFRGALCRSPGGWQMSWSDNRTHEQVR